MVAREGMGDPPPNGGAWGEGPSETGQLGWAKAAKCRPMGNRSA